MAKRKLLEILLSRFKKENTLVLQKREICKVCPFNTKNMEKVSLKQKLISVLSKAYTYITFSKFKNLGYCSICTCDVYFKALSNDDCPQKHWDLIRLKPDIFKVEITSDDSLFFTFKKGNYSLYLERFFDNSEEEAILHGFKINDSIKGFCGKYEDAVKKIENIINGNN